MPNGEVQLSPGETMSTKQTTTQKGDHIRRVGIVFSGGPAPAANAVISSAAISFLEDDRAGDRLLSRLLEPAGLPPGHAPAAARRALPDLHREDLSGLRNSRGIVIGTARANPGKGIEKPADLDDPEKTARLRNVYNALVDLEIDALISIGGDDTLKTANFLHEYQKHLPPDARDVQVVHLPKTIDNDYRGIDFTFGFFTAVDVMAKELQNLRADAMATGSYFIVETMGRKAGWLSYGVGDRRRGEPRASRVEDVDGTIASSKRPPTKTATQKERRLSLDALVDRIVDLIVTREKRDKHYGTVVLAEGLAEMLPESSLKNLPRDEHGHLSLGRIDLGKLVAELVSERYHERTGRKKKLTGLQLGYESRCAPPHAFDVMLGSQLGIGAYRALVEENLDGHMVSVGGQLDLTYVPFKDLIDPQTLKTDVRFIRHGSRLFQTRALLSKRRIPTRVADWSPGTRAARV